MHLLISIQVCHRRGALSESTHTIKKAGFLLLDLLQNHASMAPTLQGAGRPTKNRKTAAEGGFLLLAHNFPHTSHIQLIHVHALRPYSRTTKPSCLSEILLIRGVVRPNLAWIDPCRARAYAAMAILHNFLGQQVRVAMKRGDLPIYVMHRNDGHPCSCCRLCAVGMLPFPSNQKADQLRFSTGMFFTSIPFPWFRCLNI